jgi:hypothetical protein
MRHYQRHRLPAPQMSETGREAGRIIQAGGQGSVYRLLNETLWDFCTNLTARIDAGLAATGAPWSNPPPGRTIGPHETRLEKWRRRTGVN